LNKKSEKRQGFFKACLQIRKLWETCQWCDLVSSKIELLH